MRRMLTIAKYIILQHLRNIGITLGQMLVFPLVVIFILGMALSPAFEDRKLDPTRVGYLNEDAGVMGGLVDDFLSRGEITELLEVKAIPSREKGLELLKDGEISALIHIEADYSEQVLAGNKAEIKVTGHPGRQLGVAIVETIMESFTYGGNATYALAAMGSQLEYAPAFGSIEEHTVSASGLKPNAMGYYAVTMLVMMAMYGAIYAAYDMGQNYMEPVGLRVMSTPVRPWEQYAGTVLANLVTVYLQGLIIIAFTYLAFDVYWGPNLPLILLIVFVHVTLAVGLGTMAVMLTRDIARASGLLNILVVALTFLAGGYFEVNLPGSFQWGQYLSPNFLAQTALFNTIYGGPRNETLVMLAAMAGIILVTFTVSMLAQRRVVQ